MSGHTVSQVANLYVSIQYRNPLNDNYTGNNFVIVRSGINSVMDLKGKKVATVKRHSAFHDYRDELMGLLRRHSQEAVAVT